MMSTRSCSRRVCTDITETCSQCVCVREMILYYNSRTDATAMVYMVMIVMMMVVLVVGTLLRPR